jgi:hypothetical protein
MKRKLLASVALGLAGVLATAEGAFAHDCLNLSRRPATPGTAKGPWEVVELPFLEEPAWLFHPPANFMNGEDHSLLGNARCPSSRMVGQTKGTLDPDDLNGIWSMECADKAEAGL